MGASQSAQDLSEDEQQDDAEEEEEEEEEEDEDENDDVRHDIPSDARDQTVSKKTLEQEPEILPCHASASPLSPQLSAHGTPRTGGPSIKVWDPCHVLSPPRTFLRSFSAAADEDRALTEVYLISHGECHMNLRPDLISGRCPDASLTPNGKRQARALAVFLKSRGVRFNAVYTSPLDRVRATALSVCQELNFSEEHVQSSDALTEMSQGQWEGCHRSEIYTPETVSLMEKFQPDFSPPSGESLRQVEFRMVQFLNCTVMAFPKKYRSDFSPPDPTENHLAPPPPPPNWDLQHKHRVGLHRKKSGKSRLQMVMKTGDNEADDEMSPRVPLMQGLVRELSVRTNSNNNKNNNTDNNNNNINPPSSCVGVFSHPTPIKCLVTGVLGCSPVMLNKICVEDSSVTVLQHSWRGGWQIKRLNDTSHLRLL